MNEVNRKQQEKQIQNKENKQKKKKGKRRMSVKAKEIDWLIDI